MEVTMKATADHVVALERALAAPRGPKAVWLLVDPSKSKPVKIELDPKGDYPDVDRSNNTWPRSK